MINKKTIKKCWFSHVGSYIPCNKKAVGTVYGVPYCSEHIQPQRWAELEDIQKEVYHNIGWC